MYVVKSSLSHDEIVDVRKNAVSVVRENFDPSQSINNLRLLASTVRDDIDDVDLIVELLRNPDLYPDKVDKSVLWSRKYTLDLFDKEVKVLLNSCE